MKLDGFPNLRTWRSMFMEINLVGNSAGQSDGETASVVCKGFPVDVHYKNCKRGFFGRKEMMILDVKLDQYKGAKSSKNITLIVCTPHNRASKYTKQNKVIKLKELTNPQFQFQHFFLKSSTGKSIMIYKTWKAIGPKRQLQVSQINILRNFTWNIHHDRLYSSVQSVSINIKGYKSSG